MLADHKIQIEKNFEEYIPGPEPVPDDPETSPGRVLAKTDIEVADQIRIKIMIWNKTDKFLSYYFINEHG
jgi:hypothetical protein